MRCAESSIQYGLSTVLLWTLNQDREDRAALELPIIIFCFAGG